MNISVETGRRIDPDTAASSERAATAAATAAFLRRDRINPGSDYVAPADPVEMRLAALWAEILHIDRIGSRDNFFALGGDSMQAAALFQRLGAEFGIAVAPSTILERPTVAELALLLPGAPKPDSDGSLVVLQAEGEDPPLFFFHAAGGNVICYRHVIRHLGPGRRMFGFAYPHQDRIPALRLSIPEMAARYIESIKRIQPAGPYFLIGYSLGGNIAYEAARQLRARGDRMALVVLVDSLPPDPLTKGLQRVARKLSIHLGALSNEPVVAWGPYIWRCIRKEFDQVGRMRKLAPGPGIAAPAAPPNPQQHVVDALGAAHAAYFPPPYDGPIKLFRCTQGGGVRWALTHLGWGGRALGGIELSELPTGHYDPMGEPIAGLVAAELKRWLDEAAD